MKYYKLAHINMDIMLVHINISTRNQISSEIINNNKQA